jgi:hypothetical protein
MSQSQMSGLADEFWLAAYDNTKDEPRIPSYPLGVGLATGLMAEMIDAQLGGLRDGEFFRWTDRLPEDPALCAVMAAMLDDEQNWPSVPPEMVAQPFPAVGVATVSQQAAQVPRHRQRGHDLAVWLEYLAKEQRAERPVVDRVVRTGRAVLKERIRLFHGTSKRIVPRNSVVSGTPAFAINEAVRRGLAHELTTAQLVLVGLFLATRLDHHALATLEPRERDALNNELRRLKTSIPWAAELLKTADMTVSSTTVTRR